MTTKKYYCLKIGYSKYYFESKENAVEVFNLLSTMPILDIDSTMVDKLKADDFSDYEYLHHLQGLHEVSLTVETLNIYAKSEVDKIKKEREGKAKKS